ncbi:GNAT family N-acetyltransferase [Actinosynnema sp. CA-248983]
MWTNSRPLHAEPAVMRYLESGKPLDRATVATTLLPRLMTKPGWWAGEDKTTGRFLGMFAFKETEPGVRELGYRLHPTTWGQGYATEVSRALIDKGFRELGVQRIFAVTMTVNTGSRRVMERVGLRFVRTFFQDWPEPIPGSEHGEVEYAITRDDL